MDSSVVKSASKEKAWRSVGVVGLIVFLFSGRTSSRGIIMYRYTFPSWPSCLVLFCYDSPSTGTSPNCFCTTSGLWKKCKGTSFMATCVLESTDNCRACLARTYLQSPNLFVRLQQSGDHAASIWMLGRRPSRRNGALRTGICAFP